MLNELRGLTSLRALVIDYYTNQHNYIKPGSLNHWHDDEYRCQVKSFEDVSGLTKLGSGAYSDVYDLGTGKVLKIIKHSDASYLQYAMLCRKHRGNPHMPIIYYMGMWGPKRVYILEKLEMGKESDKRKRLFVGAIRTGPSAYVQFASPDIQLMAELYEQECWDDMHDANIMLRGEICVLTDPAC